MDPAAEPPLPPPKPPQLTLAADPSARSRKIQWIALVVLLFMPAVLTGTVLVLILLLQLTASHEQLIVTVPWLTAVVSAILFARVGLRRGWHTRKTLLGGWVLLALSVLAILGFAVPAFLNVRDSSKLKAMIPRQPAAAIDQFFLENPYRIFLKYDELVGPDRYIRSYNGVDGEDLSAQFPIRQGWSEPLPVRLPDGTTVRRLEVLAAIGKSGLIATYPRPQDDQFDPKRVYRLDCGVSFRDWHVVNLPPDPAGREGRDQDGVHTYQFPDGRRFEITYRSGVPDGPFHAYCADGSLWGEARYSHGRVTGPVWKYLVDPRFDEMDPEQIPVNAARRKLAAGDFHGALNDFNRAMRFDPNDLELLLGRADAYVGLGDIDQAVADLQRVQARDKEQGWKDEAAKLAERIDDLTQRQAQLGKTVDHVPGAPGPTRPWLLKQAGLKSAKHDYAGAITDYTSALDIKPDAPGYRGRADARRALGDFAGAGADYDRALGLEDDSLNKAIIQYERGHLRRLKGDLLGAVADFRPLAQYAHFSLRPDCCDASFWLFLAQCELGHPDQAAAELSHRLAIDKVPWDEADWTIAQFLLGHISEAQLDRTQPQPAYVMWTLKAPFYSAMLRRRAGDNAGALKRFRQALTSPILKMGHEYEIEAAEARRAVAALTARGE